jgi:hypothetical protein
MNINCTDWTVPFGCFFCFTDFHPTIVNFFLILFKLMFSSKIFVGKSTTRSLLTSLQPDLCWQVYNQIIVDKSTTRSLLTSLQPDHCWQVYNQIIVDKSTTRSLLTSLQPDLCWQVYNQIFVDKSTTRSLLTSLQPDHCLQLFALSSFTQFCNYSCTFV